MAEQARLNKEEFSKLSHKQKKALFRKLKRKEKRQAEAQAREEQNRKEEEERKKSPSYEARLAEEEEKEEHIRLQIEAESRRQHELWLWSEEVAAEKLRQKKEQEEKERAVKLEIERKIKEEWEERQRKEKEEEEERKKKKDKQESLLREARANENKDDGSWHNPLAPVQYGQERQVQSCPFFTKVGACRFGDRCSRAHHYPDSSSTLLLPNMYSHFELEQGLCEEYDTDIILEYDEGELYTKFREFYEDVLPEFKSIGRVVMFKVSCNYESHLRGNVYVQYAREEHALDAFVKFNARWYAGKQLTCQFITIPSWRSAICGLHNKGTCPKGRTCNFLHVFRNPNNEFWEAERGYNTPASQDRGRRVPSHRGTHHRSRSRSPRQRHSRSRSRSRSRRRRRSRSTSTSPSRNHREHSQRDRGHLRSRERSYVSRSSRRERNRSRERSYVKDRSRSRSQDKTGSSSGRSRRNSKEKSEGKNKHRSKSHSLEDSVNPNHSSGVDKENVASPDRERDICETDCEQQKHHEAVDYPSPSYTSSSVGIGDGEDTRNQEPDIQSLEERSRSRSLSSSRSNETSGKHKKHKSKKHKKHKHKHRS